jgi:uncharacterized protein YqgC (DUF456 family)
MEFFFSLLGFSLLAAGLLAIPFGIPGTYIILAGILVLGFATDFSGAIGPWFVAAMALLTLIAETADNWLTMLGARRFGASKASMWLSFLGGLAGALIIGAPLALVLGPLGPIAGGFVGAFAIVVLNEHRQTNNWKDAVRAGWGALLGRMAGIVLKLIIAIAMVSAVVIAILGA